MGLLYHPSAMSLLPSHCNSIKTYKVGGCLNNSKFSDFLLDFLRKIYTQQFSFFFFLNQIRVMSITCWMISVVVHCTNRKRPVMCCVTDNSQSGGTGSPFKTGNDFNSFSGKIHTNQKWWSAMTTPILERLDVNEVHFGGHSVITWKKKNV